MRTPQQKLSKLRQTKKALERNLMMVTLSWTMRTLKYSQMQKKQLTTLQMMTLL